MSQIPKPYKKIIDFPGNPESDETFRTRFVQYVKENPQLFTQADKFKIVVSKNSYRYDPAIVLDKDLKVVQSSRPSGYTDLDMFVVPKSVVAQVGGLEQALAFYKDVHEDDWDLFVQNSDGVVESTMPEELYEDSDEEEDEEYASLEPEYEQNPQQASSRNVTSEENPQTGGKRRKRVVKRVKKTTKKVVRGKKNVKKSTKKSMKKRTTRKYNGKRKTMRKSVKKTTTRRRHTRKTK